MDVPVWGQITFPGESTRPERALRALWDTVSQGGTGRRARQDGSRMRIPLADLVAQYRTIQPEIEEAVRQVLESGQFILGPNVAALEQEVADYLGVAHGVGVG